MNATGWAKIGFILLTLPDELEAINSRLDDIVKRLFYGRDRGHLPVEVIDEDLAVSPGHNGKYLGDTGLRPNVLARQGSSFIQGTVESDA